jgi:haloalkane dehalogenase
LRKHFRCIVVDLPGLGLSNVPLERGRAYASNANWYQRFVQALDLPSFTLLIHATAGPSALEMAVRERDRIAGLVVTNSFAWSLADVPKFRTFIALLSSRPLAFANVYLGLLPRIASRYGRRTRPFEPAERSAVAGPFRNRQRRQHLQNLLLGLRVEDAFFRQLTERVASLRDVPTLLLYGARDKGYQLGFLKRWQRLLPKHEVVVLDQADHFLPEDQPEEYTTSVAEWWHRAMDNTETAGGAMPVELP